MCWRAVGGFDVASRTVRGTVTLAIRWRSSYLRPLMAGLGERLLAQQALLAADLRLRLTPAFLVGLGDDRRDRRGLSLRIQSDEHQVRAGHMTVLSGGYGLDVDASPDLPRRAVRVVDHRLDGDEIADVHGREKAHVVHGCGDDTPARVPHRGDACGGVDEPHDRAAVDVPGVVDVLHLHDQADDGA